MKAFGRMGSPIVESGRMGSRTVVSSLVLCFLSSIVFCASLCAAWLENGSPVCTSRGDQLSVEATTDGAGGAIITWYDGGIHAQRIDASGTLLWIPEGVSVSTALRSQSPFIISDGSGGAIITWTDFRSTTNFDVYAQRLNADGNASWSAEGVAICTTACNETCRDITSDGEGGAIITWSDDRLDGDCNIYAQHVSASGEILWTANGMGICRAEQDQGYPQIVPDGAGGAVIAWADFRNGTDWLIYAQRVDKYGVTLWTPNGVAICTTRGSKLPRVAPDGTGGAIITWRDPRRTTDYDIYAQHVDSSGKVLWTEDGITICSISGDKWWPMIVSDGGGGAIIAWRDYRNGTNYDIYAQRVDSSGKTMWKSNGVPLTTARFNERYHDMIADSTGGAIVAWYDEHLRGNYDIYAQRVNSSGSILWGTNGTPVCTAVEDQQYPVIVLESTGDIIVTWLDLRSGTNYDVFAQRVKPDGSLGPLGHAQSQIEPAPCR